MSLPQDKYMLLSFINTQLRDNYSDLDEFSKAYNIGKEQVINDLNSIDYVYDEKLNKFV